MIGPFHYKISKQEKKQQGQKGNQKELSINLSFNFE